MKVRIEKDKLLAAIKKQKEEHAKSYKEAQEGWRTNMMQIASEIMQKGPRLSKFPMALRRINSPPECHLQDFDDAISMIEMASDEVIVLTAEDYEQLVLGRWQWQREWTTSNSQYMGGGRRSAKISDDELE